MSKLLQGLLVYAGKNGNVPVRTICAPKRFPLLSNATSFTALVCPFSVRSNSPVSQSQIFTVAASLADAITLNVGWNATLSTCPRCPVSTYAAGALGTQSVWRAARLAGDSDNSSCSEALRFSRSMIYQRIVCPNIVEILVKIMTLDRKTCMRTFFCNRITLVHFFSSSPTYFPFGSGVYSTPVSDLSALNASVKLFACKYSRIDF